MRSFVLRRARAEDIDSVINLLREAARWLIRRNIDQWPAEGFPASRISRSLAHGNVYLINAVDGTAAATVTVDTLADPEFWRAEDRPADALYVHKLAVSRLFSGHGLGTILLDWAAGRAARSGRRWIRLDCAKKNAGLQAFYLSQGFHHVRTVDLPHRSSGALFQRPAAVRAYRGPTQLHDATEHHSAGCVRCRTRRARRPAV